VADSVRENQISWVPLLQLSIYLDRVESIPNMQRCRNWYTDLNLINNIPNDAHVAEMVDASDFDYWSALEETLGVELLKFGEAFHMVIPS